MWAISLSALSIEKPDQKVLILHNKPYFISPDISELNFSVDKTPGIPCFKIN
jgi:hypothetical protein